MNVAVELLVRSDAGVRRGQSAAVRTMDAAVTAGQMRGVANFFLPQTSTRPRRGCRLLPSVNSVA